ncbi:Dephospho-CoA kinase, partial [Armadillidium nasatum]
MFIVGLTGGIGTGKSVVATMIQDRGIKVIDADAIARQIVEPGQPAYKKIEDGFGSNVFKENGELDRTKLGVEIFSDVEKRKLLNSITHPYIYGEIRKQKQRLLDRKYPPEEARRRIEAQLPLEEKTEMASFVIENSGSLSNTREQVEDILKLLRASRHHIWNKSLIFIALFVISAILIYLLSLFVSSR